MKQLNTYIACLVFLCTLTLNAQGLKRSGKKIIDENGQEVLLRGVGLGGWMLQEGYMMNSSVGADTQHEFVEKLNLLIGEAETEIFYENWRANFVTKQDIDSIAKWGYNSVRLAMHYNLFTPPIEEEPVAGENTWRTTGFEMVDELLTWCEEKQIYLILDLHAAPGGQGKDAAISDYDPDKPSLWESEDNKAKTVALWGKLAETYKDKKWIGGYDLINEINWELGPTDLRNLYVRITNAIRAHDTEHIIFIEGNWFANDFTGLTPPWDDNMVYSFHKYWTFNDTASIQWVLDMRNQYNTPLWMGESGENSNVWYTEAIDLFESNNIGWSWWPWKRIETIVSPFSINSNPQYEAIINYWKGEGAKPSAADAIAGLKQLTDDLLVDNNTYYKDVVDAVLRQPNDPSLVPYKDHTIPGLIYLSDYDLGTNGIAYNDMDYGNYALSTDNYQNWNSGWQYRNDGVDIQTSTDNVNNNGYQIGYTQKGEWLKYTVNVSEEGYYDCKFRYATEQTGCAVQLFMDGIDITGKVALGRTGNWNYFVNQTIRNSYLEAGTHVLKVLVAGEGSFNMSSIEFYKTSNPNTSFELVSANTNDDESSISLVCNLPLADQEIDASNFSITVNNEAVNIVSAEIANTNNRSIHLNTDSSFYSEDIIKVSYSGTDIVNTSNVSLATFTNVTVENNLVQRALIPGKIQVENFETQVGLALEDTEDVGGGQNLGYTDAGDYATYNVFVQNSGTFNLQVRTAAAYDSGRIQFELSKDGTTETISTINLPVTGGWQSWTTSATQTTLEAGIYTLKMKILKSGFNINWFDFEFTGNLSSGDALYTGVSVYPNPFTDILYVQTTDGSALESLIIRDIQGRILKHLKPIKAQKYALENLEPGVYILEGTSENRSFQRKIIKK
ncbi:MAG: carbohydrate-binding protein [Flavicella sp.]